MSLSPSLPLHRFTPANAALGALVTAVVALMVVPLPTALLDLLIASNLAGSVLLLLVCLYASHALKIAAFPTLLLLTTLFRLALNVASTRLILLQANAGEVIQAFGQYVVRGNYVVGAVIFLILTLIQFIVIAKGSERVAEVGARFTLDAMPGKQLAIDAELRAGSIDAAEAKHLRRELARESQFYGAMDGAMKFVKGDVVASFLITLVNIIGGLAIGVGQRGMDGVAALKRYGLLTIGDGLVSQIPALIIATAAGVLVTRVASEARDTPLGEELFAQVFGQPQALRVAGAFVLLLATVPGLPAFPFLVIGGLLLLTAQAGLRRLRRAADAAFLEPPPAPLPPDEARRHVPGVIPWSVEFGTSVAAALTQAAGAPPNQGLRSLRLALGNRLFHERGVPLPRGQLAPNPSLGPWQVTLLIREIPAGTFEVPSDALDVNHSVTERLLQLLRARTADFLGISETQALLDQLEQLAPHSVQQLVPKPLTLPLLCEVLRLLLAEQLSVRDLKTIVESLAHVSQTEKDPQILAEHVRVQLKRVITYELSGGRANLEVYLLERVVEDTLRAAVARGEAGSFLALAPAAARDIVRGAERCLAENPPSEGRPVVILTAPDVRRFVRQITALDLPQARVVAFTELLPDVNLLPLGRIKPL